MHLTQLLFESACYVNDYLCYNLSSHIYHDNFCSANADRRAFYQEKIDELIVLPGPAHVEGLCSLLNTNPLRQTVIRLDLPDSCIPPEVLDNFRAEDEAARLFFLNNPPRFFVGEVNGRVALYDRTHSLTQPVYAPIFYYKT